MASSFPFDNENIGAGPFLTLKISTTTNQGFTQSDIDAGNTACVISANNTVAKGGAGERVFGKVIWVSEELVSGTTVPVLCSVQARGVARFNYTTTAPAVGNWVEVDGTGKVRQASTVADVPAGGLKHNGYVIAVNTTNQTCDVWLG